MTEARIARGGLLQTDTGLRMIPGVQSIGQPNASGRAEDEFGLFQTLGILWEGKWIVLLIAALAALAAVLHIYLATPLYTAAAHIVLETEQKTVVDLEGIASNTPAEQHAMNTELLVLRSHELMTSVVNELGLDSDPEFNPVLRDGPIWRRVLDLIPGPTTGAVDGRGVPAPGPRDAGVTVTEALLRKVRVAIVPNTYAFRVTAETISPEKSAAIANAIAERYIENQRAKRFDAMEHALSWLSARVVELKQDLETAEAAIEDYASKASTVNERMLSANMRKLQSMRERRETHAVRAEELRARIARLRTLREARNFAPVLHLTEDPELRALADDLVSVPDNPRRLADFDARLKTVTVRLDKEAGRLESQSAAFVSAIGELESEVDLQSADLVNLRQLRREADATRLLYEHFLARMKELSVQQGVQQADSRLLSPAKVPARPSSPKIASTIVLGSTGGLVLGFCLVLLRDRLRSTLHSPEELEAICGQSVIGVLPEAAVRQPRRLLDQIVARPSLGFPEAIRNLRASIRHSSLDGSPKVVMFTSSEPEEGKSTVAAALAATSAMAGSRVLLIDADLRRRAIREFFGAPDGYGLVSVLRGEASREEAVFRDERTGLDVLFADDHELRASDFFESSRFDFFLRDLRKNYDLVVIDTPPVLIVPDARVIGQSADAIIYVARWNSTTSRMVRTGVELLRQVSLPVAGAVLTRVDSRNMTRCGLYGYGEGRGARKFERYYAT